MSENARDRAVGWGSYPIDEKNFRITDSACDPQFHIDKYGHIVVPVLGRPFLGSEEIVYHQHRGKQVNACAQKVLTSPGKSSYDANHILNRDELHQIILVPSTTFDAINHQGEALAEVSKIGLQKMKAGAMLRLMEHVSYESLMRLGVTSVVGWHDPIEVLLGKTEAEEKGKDRDGYLLEIDCGTQDDHCIFLSAQNADPQYDFMPECLLAFSRSR